MINPFFSIFVALIKPLFVAIFLNKFFCEKFLILKSEDLYSDPSKIYQQTLDFLGLKKHELNLFQAHRMRKYSPISKKTREKLTNYFMPYNEQLYQLLGRNLDWE